MRRVSRAVLLFAALVGLPDHGPFMLSGHITNRDPALLHLVEPGAQGGQVAVGPGDLLDKDPRHGAGPDGAFESAFAQVVLGPEDPGLSMGEAHVVHGLAKGGQGVEIGAVSDLLDQGPVPLGLTLDPGVSGSDSSSPSTWYR